MKWGKKNNHSPKYPLELIVLQTCLRFVISQSLGFILIFLGRHLKNVESAIQIRTSWRHWAGGETELQESNL